MYHSTDLIHWRYIGPEAAAKIPVGKADPVTTNKLLSAMASAGEEVNLITTVPAKATDKTIPVALLQQLQQHHQQMKQQEQKQHELKRKQEQAEKEREELEKRKRQEEQAMKQLQEFNQQREAQSLKQKQYLEEQKQLELQQQHQDEYKLIQLQALEQQQKLLIREFEQYEQEHHEQQQPEQQGSSENSFEDENHHLPSSEAPVYAPAEPQEPLTEEQRLKRLEQEIQFAKIAEHQKKKRQWVLQKQRQRAMQKMQQHQRVQQMKQAKVSPPVDSDHPRRLFTCQFCPYSTTFGNRYRTHNINHTMGFEFARLQHKAATDGTRSAATDEQEGKSQCPFCSFRAHGPTGVCRHVRVHFDFQRYLEMRGLEVKYERCWLETDTIQVKTRGKTKPYSIVPSTLNVERDSSS